MKTCFHGFTVNVTRNVEAGIQPFDIQSESLPLKQSNISSVLESAEVTSKTAMGKMFSCEAPYTAKAKEGSLESRNSEKVRDNGKRCQSL